MALEAGELAGRIATIKRRVAAAAACSGRPAAAITIVAVSKTVPAERIVAGRELGLTAFGENRVQEAIHKIARVSELGVVDAHWHLVGHLQTNKTRQAVSDFELIHSVDSLHLATSIGKAAGEIGTTANVLLQVNIAREPTKHGFAPDELDQAAAEIVAMPHLYVQGLMTIAPIWPPEDLRAVFRELRRLRDGLRLRYPAIDWHHLSMGMSDDFELAIEEGATMVRIGRAIFGEREALDRLRLRR